MSLPAVADFRHPGTTDFLRENLVIPLEDGEISVRVFEPPDTVTPDTGDLVPTLDLEEPVLFIPLENHEVLPKTSQLTLAVPESFHLPAVFIINTVLPVLALNI
jgi:hypothetical protein